MFLNLLAEFSSQGISSQLVEGANIFQFNALRIVLLEVVEGALQPGHGVKVLLQGAVITTHRAGT